MRPSMLGDAARRPGDHLAGHGHRPAAPALISATVDIAVIARQVATAVNFKYELAERYGRPAHARSFGSDRGIKGRDGHDTYRRLGKNAAKRIAQRNITQRRNIRQRNLPQISQGRWNFWPCVVGNFHATTRLMSRRGCRHGDLDFPACLLPAVTNAKSAGGPASSTIVTPSDYAVPGGLAMTRWPTSETASRPTFPAKPEGTRHTLHGLRRIRTRLGQMAGHRSVTRITYAPGGTRVRQSARHPMAVIPSRGGP